MSEAVFGLLGVFIGALLTLIKDAWSDMRMRARHARYLSVRIACILDRYVNECVEVVQDDGGQQDQEGCLHPQISLPAPLIYPDDVDWKSIDCELMYVLLTLPGEAEAANRSIAFVCSEVAFPPDYEEVFEERQHQYARLGLAASDLAQRLRNVYNIPAQNPGGWNPSQYLRKKKDKIDQARANSASAMS
ncbi:MAG: hypothetical protein COA65_01275 [Rhodospirillaceae bacterium]|nr:MAG: hypothetical protein COA65_01275 [Rhodospirillaceae bacterium]